MSVERLADCDSLIAWTDGDSQPVQGARKSELSSFLLEMADRSSISPSHAVFLPMSGYDIGDYLGLAVETVSRALTELRQRHAIAFRSVRQVRICDRGALEGLAEKLAEPPRIHPPHGTPALVGRRETNLLSN